MSGQRQPLGLSVAWGQCWSPGPEEMRCDDVKGHEGDHSQAGLPSIFWRVIDHGPEGDPAHRYYAKVREFGASSWSPEAALAEVRRMQTAACDAEEGTL